MQDEIRDIKVNIMMLQLLVTRITRMLGYLARIIKSQLKTLIIITALITLQ